MKPVSRYTGEPTPRGETEFQCHQEMNLHSTGYDWLVIVDGWAQYKGSGTINGEGDYGFIVTLIDGKIRGGADRFRIKVWDKPSGLVVYDNQMGEPDLVDPVVPLDKGSIIIHDKAK